MPAGWHPLMSAAEPVTEWRPVHHADWWGCRRASMESSVAACRHSRSGMHRGAWQLISVRAHPVATTGIARWQGMAETALPGKSGLQHDAPQALLRLHTHVRFSGRFERKDPVYHRHERSLLREVAQCVE